MAEFVKVAKVGELAPGECKAIDLGDLSLALFNVNGAYYALRNECSHVGGPLGEGTLTGDVVTCPWHRATFNVATGEALSAPAREPVSSFPVKVENDDILAQIE